MLRTVLLLCLGVTGFPGVSGSTSVLVATFTTRGKHSGINLGLNFLSYVISFTIIISGCDKVNILITTGEQSDLDIGQVTKTLSRSFIRYL